MSTNDMSRPSMFLDATPAEQMREIFDRAHSGQKITRREVVEMYANRQNWRHTQLADGSHGWVWRGPVIWAPEAALWALAPSEQEIEQFMDEWDRGEHQLSPEDAAALDARYPDLQEALKALLLKGARL